MSSNYFIKVILYTFQYVVIHHKISNLKDVLGMFLVNTICYITKLNLKLNWSTISHCLKLLSILRVVKMWLHFFLSCVIPYEVDFDREDEFDIDDGDGHSYNDDEFVEIRK